MIIIKLILKYNLLLLVVIALVCSCEQNVPSNDLTTVREGEPVEVRLDIQVRDMIQVQTRAVADDEITEDGIYALVFDASNKLIEVVKVNAAAGRYTVKLVSSSSQRKVVVVANAAEAINKLLPKLTAKEWTYDELRTEILAPELPHTGTPGNADCRITAMSTQHPMTGSIELPSGINQATVINSTGVAGGAPLLLSRNTVKVTVAINTAAGADPSLADFALQGANLAFAPLTARVLPAPTEEALPVFPAGHYVGTGGALSDMMAGAVAGGKSTESLYCYASAKKNKTYVVIKATYKGNPTPCYYRLDLRVKRAQLELKGNVHYIIRINKVGKEGYATPEEAMANVASNNISSEIIITDPPTSFIVNEGNSFLGLSAILYVMPAGAQTNIVVSTVTHNAMEANPIGAITVYGNGLSLINGADLPVSTDGSIQRKDIQVSVTEAFTSGSVIINLGGKLTQTIAITRTTIPPPDHPLERLEITYSDLNMAGMSWYEAMGRDKTANTTLVGSTMGPLNTGCNTLGAGWRVPTMVELKLMYDSEHVPGSPIRQLKYWSSDEMNATRSLALDLEYARPGQNVDAFVVITKKDVPCYVRCVKDK